MGRNMKTPSSRGLEKENSASSYAMATSIGSKSNILLIKSKQALYRDIVSKSHLNHQIHLLITPHSKHTEVH